MLQPLPGLVVCACMLVAQGLVAQGPAAPAPHQMQLDAQDSSTEAFAIEAPETLADIYGGSREAIELHRSLMPYLLQPDNRERTPLQRVQGQADPLAQAYLFGRDILVLTPSSNAQQSVTMPEGVWVNFWTGSQIMGGQTVMLDLRDEALPMWVRSGTVIPRAITEIAPLGRTVAANVNAPTTCTESCLYDLLPGLASPDAVATMVEGRTLLRSSNALEIKGGRTNATVRWRFESIREARLNGQRVAIHASAEGPYVTFPHSGTSILTWQTNDRSKAYAR